MISVRNQSLRFAQCPFCRSAFGAADRILRCTECQTDQHASCWIENGNRCSVFSCGRQENIVVTSRGTVPRLIWILLLFHLVINISSNFFINSFAPLVFSLRIQDALIVSSLELFLILSGLAAWRYFRLFYGSAATDSSPLVFLHLIVLSGNVIFLSTLAFYALSEGLQSIYALIRV